MNETSGFIFFGSHLFKKKKKAPGISRIYTLPQCQTVVNDK